MQGTMISGDRGQGLSTTVLIRECAQSQQHHNEYQRVHGHLLRMGAGDGEGWRDGPPILRTRSAAISNYMDRGVRPCACSAILARASSGNGISPLSRR